MKFTTNLKYALTLVVLLSFTFASAQEVIEEGVVEKEVVKDTVTHKRVKIDGVVAVVGDYIVLDSDLDKQFAQLEASGVSKSDMPNRCQLFGKLLEDKLYAHHAVQDSIVVNDLEIRSQVDQQFNYILEQMDGSLPRMLNFYNKDTEESLRDEMFEINKSQQLASRMKEKIVSDIEVTPEEVRQYFNEIPKEERPFFGTELKVAQIVIIPKISDAEKQKVVARLKEFKEDVLERGASFTSKVVLYSDDVASRKTGGLYTLNRKRPQMVKEFRDVAFSMQEGEISEPFETDFGYHIIYLEKIRGQEYDVRHVLLRPEVTQAAIKEAKEKIDLIRKRIVDGEITFSQAARQFSDEDETRNDGGQLINPRTQDYSFELTKMDPELYTQIESLKDNEVSLVLQDEDRINPIKFKLLTVTDRINEHEADFSKDYLKIKNLTEQDKQFKAIEKWVDEKVMDTYININGEYRNCEFESNWLKKG
ncbi:peptidylprolyl isomerase [Gelidibacter sp.]|uniref:peptidylprolyl isomerase n=1 Tax=Gelidibacter sp. TaxID=2018083 RepID=UPI002CED79A1|nr:peptidylprolyl isomerase [Gelidibacter sp.]HUH27477.1 peptidylprolyl isomerase [Gelidibacter sp.]